MKLGWYGDDFTGATDTLATAALAQWRSLLFLGVPTPRHMSQAGELDAIGIAGSARTMAPPEMARELVPVGEFFRRAGVSVLLYKCCSTFDSSPGIGSLGAAMKLLRPYVQARTVCIAGGQPGIGRFCCFGNIFASAGSEGPVSRLDRHETMRNHPVTPMREADLRLHLAHQGVESIQSVCYPEYRLPRARQDQRFDELLASPGQPPDAVLFDVAQASDLVHVGRQITRQARRHSILAVGPSSVFQSLAAYWRSRPPAPGLGGQGGGKRHGAVFVFAGSMSPVTKEQVHRAHSYTQVPLLAGSLLRDPSYVDEQLARIAFLLDEGRHVLAYVAGDTVEQQPVRPGEMAVATAEFVRRVVHRQAGRNPLRRLGIAGGDTSSLAARTLGIWALAFERVLAPGVTICRAHSDDPRLDGLGLMLKGGQMGSPDVFELFLA